MTVGAAGGLAALTLAVDRRGSTPRMGFFDGSPDTARSALSAIASSVLTLTALVFSVTVVVLALASNQFSPRVLRTFLRDRRTQVVLGVFLATFAYAMLVLRTVRDGNGIEAAFVPRASLDVAFLLSGLSLGFFVFYVHHISQSIQASSIVAEVARETAEALDRWLPAGDVAADERDFETEPGAAVVRLECRSGYLRAIDAERLVELGRVHDVQMRMVLGVGDFVPRGAALFEVVGAAAQDPLADRLLRCVTVGPTRTMQQDPAFGLRQLVDIAERALSPGINDPTTAVQALDRLHELLLLVVSREFPPAVRADRTGRVRLFVPQPSWDGLVRLAFDEIREYGEGSMQVTRRIGEVLDDLYGVAPPARRSALREQQVMLGRSAARGFADPEDQAHARTPSRHG